MNFLANCPAGSDPRPQHVFILQVQTSDANCATCHQAKETTEFDLSVPGAQKYDSNEFNTAPWSELKPFKNAVGAAVALL